MVVGLVELSSIPFFDKLLEVVARVFAGELIDVLECEEQAAAWERRKKVEEQGELDISFPPLAPDVCRG